MPAKVESVGVFLLLYAHAHTYNMSAHLSRQVIDSKFAEAVQPPRVHPSVPILHDTKNGEKIGLVSKKSGMASHVNAQELSSLTSCDKTGEHSKSSTTKRSRKFRRWATTS